MSGVPGQEEKLHNGYEDDGWTSSLLYRNEWSRKWGAYNRFNDRNTVLHFGMGFRVAGCHNAEKGGVGSADTYCFGLSKIKF